MARHEPGARQALLQTALDLFTRHGYDAVGVQKVVEETGLTKPTLYHHFGNKRGILEAICGDLETRLFETLGSALPYDGDMPATLETLVAGILRFARERPQETRLLLALQHGPVESEARQVIRPAIERLGAAVLDVFRSAVADHGNMRGREYSYTASFLGVCFTYAELLLDGHVEPAPDLAHRIMHQFSHGIYS
ncbi:MAG: TetR/AcrR family transcriptional regulator [Planctomycetota bacterium]